MTDWNSSKTAVPDPAIAQAFALKAWLTCSEQGRISRYRITTAGRNALQDLLEQKDATQTYHGFAEAQTLFAGAQAGCKISSKVLEATPKRVRYAASESPLLG